MAGLSQTPTSTDTPQAGWNRRRYADPAGVVQVEAYSIQGAGHSLPAGGMAAQAIAFFGLNGTGPSGSPSASGPSSPPVSSPPVSSPPVSSPPVSSPPPGGGGCRVTDVVNPWNTGLTSDITITNTGGTAVNGWTLVFTLPAGQSITSGWNASYSPASGQVNARNMSYNAVLPAGASTSIGFQATHTGNTARPVAFTLNGTACTVG